MIGYEINKVIVVRFNNSHIPYIKGILVNGPKDGKYLLDEFNSEILVKGLLKNNLALLEPFNFRISQLLMSFGNRTKKVVVLDQDVPLELISKKYGAKLLARKDGLEYTNKMYKDNDCNRLRKFILDTAII